MNYTMRSGEGLRFEVNRWYEALGRLKDKRTARGKRWALATVLTLVVLAKLAGEDEPEGIAAWDNY